jgi:ATP-dependent protease ClpP protease subunit
MARAVRDDIDRFGEYGIYVPSRTLVFFADVDLESAREFVRNLHVLDSASDAPIRILFRTDGGSVDDGLAMYDAVTACRSKVTIECLGAVQSIGAIILQAADRRVAHSHCTIMIHDGTNAMPDTPMRESFRAVRHDERVNKRVDEILVERIREKVPSYSYTTHVNQSLRGLYLTAEEALAKGLLDEVLVS